MVDDDGKRGRRKERRAGGESVPLSDSGFRWGDIILNDGAPAGYRKLGEIEVAVFNCLALLQSSLYSTYIAMVDGAAVDLTRVEFDLIAALASRPGAAVSRAWLVEHVLDSARDGGERTLDVHVSRLRRKLGRAGALIATVWGVGYRLDETKAPPA